MSSSSSGPTPTPSIQELRAARGTSPSPARRGRGWIVAGGVVVALIVFGFFGLPPIIKAQALKELSSRLGRPVTIEKIRINPLVLSATIEGFAIGEVAEKGGTFTGWRRLYVNLDSWSLLFGPPRLQAIELDGFSVQVAKGKDGGMNFDDIVAKLTAPAPGSTPAPAAKKDAAPPALAIDRLSVTDAKVSFEDASRERPFATVVGPLSFNLSDFHTVGDPNSPYQFEAMTAAGERLAWKGTVSANPVKSRGELAVTNVDLVRLAPYYHNLMRGELRSALVDFSGKYAFSLDGAGLPVLTLADGAFALREFRFGAPGIEDDALALKQLKVTGIAADTATGRVDIATVALAGGHVKATRDLKGIDLLSLIMPDGPADTQAPAATGPAKPLPVVTLGELSMAGMQFDVVDLTTARRAVHRIDDLSLTLRGLDSAQLGKLVPMVLEVQLPEGGRIAVSGDVAAQPLAADLDLAVSGVTFANASPYLEPMLNIRLADGALRASGKASLRDGVAKFAGDFGIAGFRAIDGKQSQDFAKWKDFAITGIKAASQPLEFHADEIRFTEPSGSVRVEADGTLSIAQAGVVKENTPAAEAVPAVEAGGGRTALPIAVSIGKLVFDNAAFRFEDRSITPAARGGISEFSGAITGLSSEALGRADVELRGKVDGLAPVAVTGKLNPLGQPAFMDVKVDFQGIDLQPGAGPYVGKFAGRELARGNLSLAVTAKLDDRKLDTNNVVTLDQFELGAKTNSPEATSLPVGLALALLRDANGKIVIDLPVKGSLDDPSFKVGRVVVRVLVNIMTKAATSPFSLLGAAFGGGGDELGWQDFAAGSEEVDEAGLKKLETVAKALNGRPALKLDLAGSYHETADLAELRAAALDRLVRSETWETRRQVDPNTPAPEALEITPELRAGMLARLYARAFPAVEGEAAVEPAAAAPAVPAAPAEEPLTVAFPVKKAETAEPRDEVGQVGRLRRYTSNSDKIGKKASSPSPFPEYAPPVTAEGAAQAAVQGGATTMSPAEMEARLAGMIEVPEDELRALGEARAQAIRAWLLDTGKVAPERIFMGPVAAKGTRVNLTLQ